MVSQPLIAGLQRLIRKYVPWFAIDAAFVIISFHVALRLRFVGSTPDHYLQAFPIYAPLIALVYCLANHFFGIYHRIWRYASAQEVVSIVSSVAASTTLLAGAVFLWAPHPLPGSVVYLGGFFTLASFTAVRYRRRLISGLLLRWRAMWGYWPIPCKRVLIVGAGEAGQLLAWQLLHQSPSQEYYVLGFIDDDPNKLGMQIHGIKILGNRYHIPAVVREKDIDMIIIASETISGQDFRDVLSICQETSARIKVLPTVFEVIEKHDGVPLLRDVAPEDLLGRKPAQLDQEACCNLLAGKVILVTGASGSIGSELCSQICAFAPKLLVMVDINESGLHDLNVRLQAKRNPPPLLCVLGDITNRVKMEALFQTYRPEIIFHAAAYKHVPLLEQHPDEAVRANVLGTAILSRLADRYKAERFVLVSTDKAVEPCSIMGATKRIGEMLVCSMARESETLYAAVRFGNVLGSRGSVVPTFAKQIEMGGPVTITHPAMKRFFMSIPEAVSLIIQAAAFAQGGEIFMLDMGEEIKIEDLAHRMIRLRGLRPDVDIPVVYTGVRPGEKLHEDLIGQGEAKLSTDHPTIFRVRNSNFIDREVLLRKVDRMISLADQQRNEELVERLWDLVRTNAHRDASGAPDEIAEIAAADGGLRLWR